MKYRCLIIPDSQAAYARELSAVVAGPTGSGMYTTPLSPTGAEPATHWISAGLINDAFAALLPLMTFPHDAEPVMTPGNAALVAQIAAEAGYQTTAGDVQALFNVSEVTEQNPFDVITRLGLQMVQQTEPDNAISR